jgi:hypothetical protein
MRVDAKLSPRVLVQFVWARGTALRLLRQNRRATMPMTNAQRQRRYRQRHHDDLAHLRSTCGLPCGIGSIG